MCRAGAVVRLMWPAAGCHSLLLAMCGSREDLPRSGAGSFFLRRALAHSHASYSGHFSRREDVSWTILHQGVLPEGSHSFLKIHINSLAEDFTTCTHEVV